MEHRERKDFSDYLKNFKRNVSSFGRVQEASATPREKMIGWLHAKTIPTTH